MAARAAQPGLVASLPKMAAAELRELAANYAVTGMGADAEACDAELARPDLGVGAAWLLKRGKKAALEAKREAYEAVKAIGTARQLRLALAA